MTSPTQEQNTESFLEVCEALTLLQEHKGKTYGDAWCKHGEAISIFGNLARKYDRLENIILNQINKEVKIPEPTSDESIAETVGDLAAYAILWMGWIRINRPEEFKSWRSKIEAMLKGAA